MITLELPRQSDDVACRPPGALHIVQGVLSLDPGGLERLVLDLVRVYCSRGHRVSVVCIERPGQLAHNAKTLGAELHCLNKPPGKSAAAVNRAAELLAALGPDVIHTHQTGALWYLGTAARRMGLSNVIHTEHSDHVTQVRSWWRKVKARLLWKRTARLARRFCCVSDDIARSAARWSTVPVAKLRTVLNGIDTARYSDDSRRASVRASLGFASDALVVGTVGRLVEVKRQDLLLRAFRRLAPRFPEARLLIVGEGPERARLQSLAGKLGLQGLVSFAGYQEHPERFLQAMDVFALTSRHEGLPLALLEAWATGLPVVASAVGGIPKLVQHERTGLLFPRESEDALVAGLGSLLSDCKLRERLGRAGHEVVERCYSLDRMAGQYERHYRHVVATAD